MLMNNFILCFLNNIILVGILCIGLNSGLKAQRNILMPLQGGKCYKILS
jgi:hypothetical protein